MAAKGTSDESCLAISTTTTGLEPICRWKWTALSHGLYNRRSLATSSSFQRSADSIIVTSVALPDRRQIQIATARLEEGRCAEIP